MSPSRTISYILDISRLLSRAGQATPTGIDRVELAYAEYLLKHHTDHTHFTALSLSSRMGSLPQEMVRPFIKALTDGWNLGDKSGVTQTAKLARRLKAHLFFAYRLPFLPQPAIYFLLSHHHLMKIKAVQSVLHQTGAIFVPMVHDLIPIEYPEYARPRELARHKSRLETIAKLADAIIVPTDSVKKSLESFLSQKTSTTPPIWIIQHGVHEQIANHLSPPGKMFTIKKPYFLYISTIEPRKNHLLLLHLWRKMVEERGKEAVPQLILIGKRGWENENILDLLDRSPSLQGVVLEKSQIPDREVNLLLKNSNGLLFSSFTEGYGLPLAEAMSLSVPSICADIPALREIGGTIPLYIDPLNTPAWERAIEDFSHKGPLWQRQKEQLRNWSPLSWEKSVACTLVHCDKLTKDL